MEYLQRFFGSLKGKRISFIGVGVSHNDLIRLFLKKGLSVTVCDSKPLGDGTDDNKKFSKALYDEFKSDGAFFALGESMEDGVLSADIVLRTPGMYFNSPLIKKAREKGVVVTSEMELFFDLCPCKIYAVTGSDGKSTTTTIISELFKAEGKRVFLGGNLGYPLLSRIEEITPDDIAVVELSSFQLISMRESPYAAAITNITPNHLNVHGTMEEYVDAKKNILAHQNAFSKAVLNMENELCASLADNVRGKFSWFSLKNKPERGSFLAPDGMLCYNDSGSVTEILHRDEIKIPGIHNVDNYLTAIALTWGDVSLDNIKKVACEFGGVEHRIEFVRELDGVKYYNDSIASSPTRVIAGLNSFDRKIIIIMGGSDKNVPFEPMVPTVLQKVKLLIVMGQTAEKIASAVRSGDGYDEKSLPIVHVNGMEEAVITAKSFARDGDIVSLSPGCASFDMYRMFEERGKHFKSIVNGLK